MRRIRDSFFLRAESYFNVATEIEALDREPSFSPPIIDAYGGKSLHEQSHGESFFALFLNRLRGNGLYFFDEPEAALSPSRILALMSVINQLDKSGRAQFLIATHSPMLICYPGATIYQFDEDGVRETGYEDTAHFSLTKSFLNNPALFLHHLIDGLNDPI